MYVCLNKFMYLKREDHEHKHYNAKHSDKMEKSMK